MNALKAFEAAARHRSFSAAAREMNVTTSAISHQIRGLEAWLDKRLFMRSSRPLVLTQDGDAYFRSVSESFDTVAEATRQMLVAPVRETLTVSTMHSFAAAWLLPRLEHFRAAHPWLDVRVRTDTRFLDLRKESCDVAVRYGKGQWPGTVTELLLDDRRLPVCSPKLLDDDEVADFRIERQTLIHDGSKPGWKEWFEVDKGSKVSRSTQGMFFTHSYLAVQAATRGYGVALASEPLVSDALTSRELVCPVFRTLEGSGAYYLVTPSGLETRENIRIFGDWLLEEARTPRRNLTA